MLCFDFTAMPASLVTHSLSLYCYRFVRQAVLARQHSNSSFWPNDSVFLWLTYISIPLSSRCSGTRPASFYTGVQLLVREYSIKILRLNSMVSLNLFQILPWLGDPGIHGNLPGSSLECHIENFALKIWHHFCCASACESLILPQCLPCDI